MLVTPFATLCLVVGPALFDPALFAPGSPPTQEVRSPLLSVPGAVDAACAWLVAHQDEDGHWDCAGFMKHDAADVPETELDDEAFWKRALGRTDAKDGASSEPDLTAGPGDPRNDIGVTSLALLALMADGHTTSAGDHQAAITRGFDWLVLAQDRNTGLIGNTEGVSFHYDHATATLALATLLSSVAGEETDAKTKYYRASLARAVRYIAAARNPYGAWRYSYPPDGDNDSSVTTWMTLALAAAQDVGVKVDQEAFRGAAAWLSEMTDQETGRVGYTERGSPSSRIPGINAGKTQKGAETLTAGALLARLRMGQNPRENGELVQHVRLMLTALEHSSTESIQDALWIFWGTAGMAQIGSLPWNEWAGVMGPALLQSQSREGQGAGSWDPTGAWGHALGRVGTTALAAHALALIERVSAPTGEEAPSNRLATHEPVDENVRLGLAWLARHQDADGRWNADDFGQHDPEQDRTTGAGDPNHDIGITGLALLAFLGDGQTPDRGEHKATVARGLAWLLESQDPDTGLFGDQIGQAFLYDHALASLALIETLNLTGSKQLTEPAQRAANYIARARNPYGVWRYSVPPDGDNDTSVTSWMLQVIRSAEDAGLKVDRESWTAARSWFDEMTDPATGRIGYLERGSRSARVAGMNDWFSTEPYEAMTAAGLYSRFLAGDAVGSSTPVMKDHADLVVRTSRALRNPEIPIDLYALYYSSRSMYQMGGDYWRQWSDALRGAVVQTQRQDGAAKGSWDPSGPWGYSGGRVYSTSMMLLNALILKRDDGLKR